MCVCVCVGQIVYPCANSCYPEALDVDNGSSYTPQKDLLSEENFFFFWGGGFGTDGPQSENKIITMTNNQQVSERSVSLDHIELGT